ncbi:MAG: DUF6259 domain-containing protein [bacterium]
MIKNNSCNLIRLENKAMCAVFDATNGALVQFTDHKTTWQIQGRAHLAQSFLMIAPLPERLMHRIAGVRQNAPLISQEDNPQRISFYWDHVVSQHTGALDIKITATVTLTNGGLKFEIKINNCSRYPVESVFYPMIGDLRNPMPGEVLSRAHMGYCNLYTKQIYPKFENERGYWGTEYPIQIVATPESPFMLIQSKEQGLYAGCHDTSAQARAEFVLELKPGYTTPPHVPPNDSLGSQDAHIEFKVAHHPFIQPSECRESSPIILKPYKGTWQAGADIYNRWRKTWMKSPLAPAWAADVHSWQMIQMNSWGDSLSVPYKQLVDFGHECKIHNVGVLHIVGWTLYGQDGRLPIHETDPRLGTWKELKRSIEKIQRMGVKVILYEKYTCVDVGTEWYKKELHKYASKDIFGNIHGHEGWQYHTPAHLAGINTRPYAWMCMNCPQWQDIALDQIEKSLLLEPDGILLDESMWHGRNAFYCFDTSHGHRVPAYNFAGDAVFEKKLVSLLKQYSAVPVLAGEGPYDLQYRHYNIAYHRTLDSHIPVTRYLSPALPMVNWVYGYDDRETINLCLLYRYAICYEPRNFQGHLDEMPLSVEYGTKVDALRRKFSDYLWDGKFQSTIGASVTVDDTPHALYSVLRNLKNGKLAILIANNSAKILEGRVRTNSAKRFQRATPENHVAAPCDGRFLIPARSAVIMIENR